MPHHTGHQFHCLQNRAHISRPITKQIQYTKQTWITHLVLLPIIEWVYGYMWWVRVDGYLFPFILQSTVFLICFCFVFHLYSWCYLFAHLCKSGDGVAGGRRENLMKFMKKTLGTTNFPSEDGLIITSFFSRINTHSNHSSCIYYELKVWFMFLGITYKVLQWNPNVVSPN